MLAGGLLGAIAGSGWYTRRQLAQKSRHKNSEISGENVQLHKLHYDDTDIEAFPEPVVQAYVQQNEETTELCGGHIKEVEDKSPSVLAEAYTLPSSLGEEQLGFRWRHKIPVRIRDSLVFRRSLTTGLEDGSQNPRSSPGPSKIPRLAMMRSLLSEGQTDQVEITAACREESHQRAGVPPRNSAKGGSEIYGSNKTKVSNRGTTRIGPSPEIKANKPLPGIPRPSGTGPQDSQPTRYSGPARASGSRTTKPLPAIPRPSRQLPTPPPQRTQVNDQGTKANRASPNAKPLPPLPLNFGRATTASQSSSRNPGRVLPPTTTRPPSRRRLSVSVRKPMSPKSSSANRPIYLTRNSYFGFEPQMTIRLVPPEPEGAGHSGRGAKGKNPASNSSESESGSTSMSRLEWSDTTASSSSGGQEAGVGSRMSKSTESSIKVGRPAWRPPGAALS